MPSHGIAPDTGSIGGGQVLDGYIHANCMRPIVFSDIKHPYAKRRLGYILIGIVLQNKLHPAPVFIETRKEVGIRLNAECAGPVYGVCLPTKGHKANRNSGTGYDRGFWYCVISDAPNLCLWRGRLEPVLAKDRGRLPIPQFWCNDSNPRLRVDWVARRVSAVNSRTRSGRERPSGCTARGGGKPT
mgnify:CR=1 FL=1